MKGFDILSSLLLLVYLNSLCNISFESCTSFKFKDKTGGDEQLEGLKGFQNDYV